MHTIEDLQLIEWMPTLMIVCGVMSVLGLQFYNAPYGRYASSSWGPLIPGKLAWVLQELPSFAIPVFIICFKDSPMLAAPANALLLGFFLLHYFQRTFLFPFLIQGGKPTPLIPFTLAFCFCFYNGYMQGRCLTYYSQNSLTRHKEFSFIFGTAVFFTGMAINIHSDHILRNLRKPGETSYKIPKGGFFDYVSGANFLGEIMEWTGYAIAANSWSATAFFIFTVLNIGPRACHHHRWYQEKFRESYPQNRKALIPFIF